MKGPLRANSCRSATAWPTGQIDPLLPFKIDPMNGREAPENGHRLNPSNAPRATVPKTSCECLSASRPNFANSAVAFLAKALVCLVSVAGLYRPKRRDRS